MVAFSKNALRPLEPCNSRAEGGGTRRWLDKRSIEALRPHEGDSMTETTSATLRHAGGELELPRIKVVEGNEGYDVSKLLKQTGAVAYDPGFMNTAATTSAITYIDGDAGILRYRGYPIEQLAQHSSFLEVSYLLIYGNLPTPTELEEFDQKIRRHTLLHEELKGFFGGFPRDAHPMPVISSAVSALSTFYQDSLDPFNAEHVEVSTIRLMAKLPVIAAYAHKKSIGQPMLYPDNSMNLVENFLRLSFGLPAEQYAITNKIHPSASVKKNTERYHEQMDRVGLSYDWEREVNTTDSEYYKWTQWIFLQFFKHGLAYKAKMPINWCPSCKIGLANEEVVDGRCERCGGETEKRDKEQWMLKITAYADKLLKGLQTVDYIPRARVQQENWIGRSEGATIEFKIQNSKFKIPVFTTRADTLFGATYLVLAPEHTMVAELSETASNRAEIEAYVASARRKTDIERTAEGKEKTGVQIQGVMAENPGTKETIPVWIADYVLAHYGTGAIMAVPAHDERDWKFALKFNLAIRHVIEQTNVRDYRKYFYFEFAFISDDDPDHIRAISYAYQ